MRDDYAGELRMYMNEVQARQQDQAVMDRWAATQGWDAETRDALELEYAAYQRMEPFYQKTWDEFLRDKAADENIYEPCESSEAALLEIANYVVRNIERISDVLRSAPGGHQDIVDSMRHLVGKYKEAYSA